MPDKQLTEAAWKTFAKGGSYKDAALLKALAALDKAEKGGAQAELDALDELDKQAELLRKANKADKKLGDYLDTLDKASAKQRKTSEAGLADEKKKAADKQSDSDDEESPALLTTKMVPLLREVRKGNSVMQALIAVAGKETVVLLSRRAISPSRGKLLKEQMTASGGLKFIRGECLFEENAVTFVVQSSAAGLAKKLKAALADQTGLKLKVRVRGEDPSDTDEEGEDAETADTGDADADQPVAGAPSQPDGVKAPNPQALAFQARVDKLEPLLAGAVKDKLANAARMRAVTDLAKQKAATGAYASAMQALDAVDRLLAEAGADAPAGTQPSTPTQQPQPQQDPDSTVDPAAAFNARLTALMPKIKDALAAAGPNGQGLKLKVGEAGALARQRRFEQGHALLDEVEDMLGGKATPEPTTGKAQAGGTDGTDPKPGRGGLVQQRVFMLERWKKIPAELKTKLGDLQKSIVVDEADDDPEELVGDISDYLNNLLSELQDEMDTAINAGNNDAFKGLAQRVEGDPMMQLLAEHPSMDGSTFRTSVLQALSEIEDNLAG